MIYDDLPELQTVSDTDDDLEDSEDKPNHDENKDGETDPFEEALKQVLEESESPPISSDDLIEQIQVVLTRCQPYPGDGEPVDPTYFPRQPRFLIEKQDRDFICIYDRIQGFEADIHETRAQWGLFSIGKLFAERCAMNSSLQAPWNHA